MRRLVLTVSFFFVVCLSVTLAQDLDVEIKKIGNQAIKEIFKDQRGLIYALPEAEPEVLLRYDGHTITRLGPEVEQAEGLELPQGYEHSWILPTKNNRLVSISNTTRQVAFIELESLRFVLYDFAQLGLSGEFLSIGFGDTPDKYLATASVGDSLRVHEWNEDGTSRSFDFSVRFSTEDAKQVAIGDTILVDIYPGGAFLYDWTGKLLKTLSMGDFSKEAKPERVGRSIYLSELRYQPDGELYAATRWISPSLWVFNRADAKFEPAVHPFNGSDGEFVSIPLQDTLGNELYAGGGWYFPRPFKLKTKGQIHDLGYALKDAVLGNRTHNHFSAFLSDDVTKTVWAASETSGLLRIDFPKERVRHVIKIFGFNNPINYGTDSILVYSVRNGLYRMGDAPRTMASNVLHVWYDNRRGVIRSGRNAAFTEPGVVWANDDNRLFRVDILGRKGYEIPLPGQIGESWTMYDDRTALLSMEAGGLLLVDLVTDSIREAPEEKLPAYRKAWTMLVREGTVYMGTDNGFYVGRLGVEGEWEEILLEGGGKVHLHSIYPESDDQWWLATDEGWLAFLPAENQLGKVYTEADGLPSSLVRSSIFAKGHYWIGTRKGLSRFSPETETFRNFTFEEGFSSRRFTEGAAYAPGSNMLGFGTDNGFNYFQPDDLLDEAPPLISLSSLTYYDGDQQRVLRNVGSPHTLQMLSLAAENRSLEAEFFLYDIATAEYHRFAYRINGESTPWIDLKGRNRLAFNALEAGQHTIEIRGRTRYSKWSQPLVLSVSAAAFFYETWWFRLGAVLLLAGIVGAWIYRLRQERETLKVKVEERTATIRRDKETIEQQAVDLMELDAAKTRFFANISHEFRTPLTVIRGFATESRKPDNTDGADKLRQRMGMIEANSNRLLLLVNQLLELGRLEAGKLAASYQRADLRPELDLILASFEGVAYDKKLRMVSAISFEELPMDLDIDKLLKILYNLLSNATKFTPEGGTISLSASLSDQGMVVISIRDTGIGIPEDKLEVIFHRFSQLDDASTRKAEGSGIGLNFARDLAELMGGTITVRSREGKGSTFELTLPRWQSETGIVSVSRDTPLQYLPLNPAPAPASTSVEDSPGQQTISLILLVEDNADIIAYLELCLGDRYRLLHARNGEEGLAKALEYIPDLVIADVMMPVMDGLEMCRKLKREERTSHIPVIMLTALGSVKNRVKGLREGADAYLSKPFVREELEAQVINLLEGRKRLQLFFSDNLTGRQVGDPVITASEAEADYTRKEQAFLARVVKVIEDRLSDQSLRTDDVAHELMVSKTQLWRKIKAVTGLSPGELIESIRLEKATVLIAAGELTMAEVGYAVGYSDPSYFTKRFSKHFGVVPSDYGGERKRG